MKTNNNSLPFLFLLLSLLTLKPSYSSTTTALIKGKEKSKVYWRSGIAAFVSPYRLTLSDGRQYYLESNLNHKCQTPIYLNGKPVPNLSLVEPGDSILLRLTAKHHFLSGIWAYHFPKRAGPSPDIFNLQTEFYKNHHHPFLKIEVQARSFGKVTVSDPGVFHSLLLFPGKPGFYENKIYFPQGIVITRSFFTIKWTRKSQKQTLIFPKPISIFTEPPQIAQISPNNGTTVHNLSPFIFVTFNLKTPPVNPGTIQLFLDGKDITHQSTLDSQAIFFDPPLPLLPGTHTCLIRGRGEKTGYPFQKKWVFVIEGTHGLKSE